MSLLVSWVLYALPLGDAVQEGGSLAGGYRADEEERSLGFRPQVGEGHGPTVSEPLRLLPFLSRPLLLQCLAYLLPHLNRHFHHFWNSGHVSNQT